jgi:hypothetical protein
MSLLDDARKLPAKAWIPKGGDDGIEGEVVAVSQFQPANGYAAYTVVTLDIGFNELVAIHCFHHVLGAQIKNDDPKPGDRLAVVYLNRPGFDGGSAYMTPTSSRSAFSAA